MLYEVFVVGGLLFWLLLLVEFVVLFACLYTRKGGNAFSALVVYFVILGAFSNVSLASIDAWIWANWTWLLIGIVAYFIIGPLWGCGFKWVRANTKRVREYDKMRDEWLEHKGQPEGEVPSHLKQEWKEWLLNDHRWHVGHGNDKRVVIEVSLKDAKWDIIRDSAWWPIDMLVYFFGDLLFEVWEEIYERLAASMKRMAERIVGDRYSDIEDIPKPKPEPPKEDKNDEDDAAN